MEENMEDIMFLEQKDDCIHIEKDPDYQEFLEKESTKE
jgi:hypothetical protein|tara:strand:+ start:1948 stop:2061 length:114 start_codon:yes stop_codon:yes gene_type:complete